MIRFYRLGLNTPVSNSSYGEYKKDGAVVFAKVAEQVLNPSDNLDGSLGIIVPAYYIWANGIEYKVADADALTRVYEKFQVLVDNASDAEGKYTNPESVHYWIQEAIEESALTAEKVYAVIDASNKIVEDASALAAIKKSAEGVNASVLLREGADASSLVFGIDLDKIYLPHGVQRTEAIGVKEATESIVTEGVGMSVKELLEYYLVKEKFPVPAKTQGSGSFDNFNILVNNLPKNVSNYITVDGSTLSSGNILLAEVGNSNINISTGSGTLTILKSGDWASSRYNNVAKIENMTFGYCTAKGELVDDGHYLPGGETHFNDTSIINTAVNYIPEYTSDYEDYIIPNIDTTTTELLTVNGNAVDSEINVSFWQFNTSIAPVIPGKNTVKLQMSYSNVSTSRTLNETEINGINPVYIISNKGHVCDDNRASVNTSTFTNITDAIVNKYGTNSSTVDTHIYGVYPIYANGTENKNSNGSGHIDLSKNSNYYWNNHSYLGNSSLGSDFAKFKLRQVENTTELYMYVGSYSGETIANKPLIYIPKQLGIEIIGTQACQTDSNGDFTQNDYKSGSAGFAEKELVDFNTNGINVSYYKFVGTGSTGTTCLKIVLGKIS